jgi:hypothetical protein
MACRTIATRLILVSRHGLCGQRSIRSAALSRLSQVRQAASSCAGKRWLAAPACQGLFNRLVSARLDVGSRRSLARFGIAYRLNTRSQVVPPRSIWASVNSDSRPVARHHVVSQTTAEAHQGGDSAGRLVSIRAGLALPPSHIGSHQAASSRDRLAHTAASSLGLERQRDLPPRLSRARTILPPDLVIAWLRSPPYHDSSRYAVPPSMRGWPRTGSSFLVSAPHAWRPSRPWCVAPGRPA